MFESEEHKLYFIKGLIYFTFFNIFGVIIFLESLTNTGAYSEVIKTVSKTYPIHFLSIAFVISAFAALIFSYKNIRWNILVFTPMIVYCVAVIVTFLYNRLDVINVPFFILTLVLNLYDTFDKSNGRK